MTLLSKFIAFLAGLLAGALGGALLFSALSPELQGIGLALIVLSPWLVGELARDRPGLEKLRLPPGWSSRKRASN